MAQLRVIFVCPNRDCREVFIGYYTEGYEPERDEGTGYFDLVSTGPTTHAGRRDE